MASLIDKFTEIFKSVPRACSIFIAINEISKKVIDAHIEEIPSDYIAYLPDQKKPFILFQHADDTFEQFKDILLKNEYQDNNIRRFLRYDIEDTKTIPRQGKKNDKEYVQHLFLPFVIENCLQSTSDISFQAEIDTRRQSRDKKILTHPLLNKNKQGIDLQQIIRNLREAKPLPNNKTGNNNSLKK